MLKARIHLRRVRRLIGLVRKLSSSNEDSINPLTPSIKEQIVLSCFHTFLIKVLGRRY